MTAAVELSGVGKCYGGRWAVREVDLALEAGQRLALLGHNGAGKTTLLKLMLGLIPPDAGRALVLGRPPGGAASPTRREIGFLPENVSFDAAMTGRETLAFYAALKGRGRGECRTLLERVGLAEAADRRVGTYSKGMRQRLGLAQALLGSPRLLLLDEPTNGLDPALRRIFYEIVDQLSRDGAAVLLSSHLLTELEERTDRIAVMRQGRRVAYGTLDELRALSDLPLAIRLRVPPGRQAEAASALALLSPVRLPDDRLAIACAAANKMPVLRHIFSLGSLISDVEVVQPGLDDVYAALSASDASDSAAEEAA